MNALRFCDVMVVFVTDVPTFSFTITSDLDGTCSTVSHRRTQSGQDEFSSYAVVWYIHIVSPSISALLINRRLCSIEDRYVLTLTTSNSRDIVSATRLSRLTHVSPAEYSKWCSSYTREVFLLRTMFDPTQYQLSEGLPGSPKLYSLVFRDGHTREKYLLLPGSCLLREYCSATGASRCLGWRT